jgi:DNA-binding NtrC family response regulator
MFESKQIIPEIWMQEPVVVVDADEKQRQKMCAVLEREDYRTVSLHSLATLNQEIQEGTRQVVILDLDTIPVDNRFFRGLKKENPGVCVIGLSSRPFHPELKEAMSSHIYACLGKPVDEEELIFWVKSLCE